MRTPEALHSGGIMAAGLRAAALFEYIWRPRNALTFLLGTLGPGFLARRLAERTNSGRARRCSEVMTTDVAVVGTGQSVRDAARIMRDLNVGFVPVCQSDHTVLGTITDRDLTVRVVADERGASATVQDVMSSELVACHPEDSVDDAAERMRQRQVNRILVLDHHNKLEGVISLSDLAVHEDARRVGRLTADISEREARH